MNEFKDAPISLGEHRTLAENDCSIWTPRELLVFLLREIDNGRWKPDGLVVCYFQRDETGTVTGMRRSKATLMEAVAMVELAKHDLLGS